MGDHTESIQIDYDPKVITCDQLLDMFWNAHSCTSTPWRRQYMAALFYDDEEGKKIAEASKSAQESKIGKLIQTQVIPMNVWTNAEDYHQKYYLRHAGIFKKLKLSDSDVLDSTLAARLNAGVHGSGDKDAVISEVEKMKNDDLKREVITVINSKFK